MPSRNDDVLTVIPATLPDDANRARGATSRSSDALAHDAARYGHEIVARATTAESLRVALATARPEIVIVGASAVYLSDVLLAACDATGLRLVALVEADAERRHAASMGLFELVDAAADWPTIERMLSRAQAHPLASQRSSTTRPSNRGVGTGRRPGSHDHRDRHRRRTRSTRALRRARGLRHPSGHR